VLGGQGLRYGIAAVVLGAAAARSRRGLAPLRRLPPRLYGRLALLAATGMVGFNAAVLAAERTAEPSVPGVLVGCAPLVLALTVPLREGRRPSSRLAGSAVLVVAGAAVVQGFGRTDAAGLGWSGLALVGEVLFSLVAVPLIAALGPVLLAAAACAAGCVEALAAGLLLDGPGALRLPSAAEAAALAWLALPVTVLAFWWWYTAVDRLGPERAGLFSGLIPVAAAVTAPLLHLGVLGPAQLLGTALVGAGVAAGLPRSGSRSRGRPRSRPRPRSRSRSDSASSTTAANVSAAPRY
jgi:drug/metabolite transporter (DMT)-like permease